MGGGVMFSRLCLGDSREVLAAGRDAGVDAVVTDPPYELGFMGKRWDGTGIAYDAEFWRECYRALKPGGHLLAFGGSRTFHRIAVGIEDAGFEIRDCLMWLYGQGFPKSLDVSKAIDKMHGAEREVTGSRMGDVGIQGGNFANASRRGVIEIRDRPATPEAEKWQGWGTALKPAYEPIILARKPLEGTVAANVLAHGTGALNIDGCRVEGAFVSGWSKSGSKASDNYCMSGPNYARDPKPDNPLGRWPANVALDEAAAEELDRQSGTSVSRKGKPRGTHRRGMLANSEWNAVGAEYDDQGGASRFFYVAKASTRERSAGLDGRNPHPTVKPIALMRWLVRLVTPPAGVVLDPFMGSGTTGIACLHEGFSFVGIDQSPEYVEVARKRITHWRNELGVLVDPEVIDFRATEATA